MNHAEALDEIVLLAVAAAGGMDRTSLTRETPLLEANVDSLTLIGLLAGLELELGIAFSDLESVELVEAHRLCEICVLVARKVEALENDTSICKKARDSGAAREGDAGFNEGERLHGEVAESVREDGDGQLDDVDA